MKNNLSIENKIDAALSSVDNIERATPSPLFSTKVMSKIKLTKTRFEAFIKFNFYMN